MDRAGIATGIALAAPVLGPDPERQSAIARSANDFGATLGRDHPGRFGLFAALPMTDVPATLAEIDYALDQLHADGFGIASSYGDKWLGDDAFQPIWEKIDARCGGGLRPPAGRALLHGRDPDLRALQGSRTADYGRLHRLADEHGPPRSSA